MCGLLGLAYTRPPAAVQRRQLGPLLDRLGHRGPDARGERYLEGVYLGHRRLSIVDPHSRADQPFCDPQQRHFILLNGEIYNYRSLRRDLERHGCRFFSDSDTEVLLHALNTWNEAALHRLNGMFAFAIWHTAQRRLLLVRDRLGIKPLYFTQGDGFLAFASSPAPIVGLRDFHRRLSLDSVSKLLSFRHVPAPDTLFENMKQLEPGSLLIWQDGRTEIKRWWQVDPAHRSRLHLADAATEVRRLIDDSVSLRKQADVPVGLYLSGGLDSSILLSAMSNGHSGVDAFITAFDETEFDESRYALEACRVFGANAHIQRLSRNELLKPLDELTVLKANPPAMHNEIAMFLQARAAREHVKVVLCGEGADELFSGYGRIFRTPQDHLRLRLAAALPFGLAAAAVPWFGQSPDEVGLDPVQQFYHRYTYFPWPDKLEIFRPAVYKEFCEDRPVRELVRRHFEDAVGRSYHDRLSYIFLVLHLPGLLDMLDATSMGAGLEARVPFLDHRLVQFALSLPENHKLQWRSATAFFRSLRLNANQISEVHDITKVVLRHAFSERLPQAIVERRKMGFPVPLNRWFDDSLRSHLEEVLLADDSPLQALLDPYRLRRWLDKLAERKDPNRGRKQWQLLSLERWLRLYMNGTTSTLV